MKHTKNELLQKHVTKDVSDLRKKILLDRVLSGKEDDTKLNELMKYMTDIEILSILTVDNAERIISAYSPYISDYRFFIKSLINAVPNDLSKYLTLLDPFKLKKYYGKKECNRTKVYRLIISYLLMGKDVPLPIITSYVNCTIHGRWFFSRYSHIVKILNDLMLSIKNDEDVSEYNKDWQLNILPTIFEFIPQHYANYGMINYKLYYDMGGKFIDNGTKGTNIIMFLESYNGTTHRTDELPSILTDIMDTVTDEEIMKRYRELVVASIAHNGNNVKLVTWGSTLSLGEIKQITSLVLQAESPLTNFNYYHYYYTTTTLASKNAVYDIDFIKDLLKRGLDYSTLQEWINCLYFIEDAIASTDIQNLTTYMNEVFPSPLIQATEEQTLRIRNMNDYIIQELSSKMSNEWISSTLYPVIFTNKDIFESLSPASIQYITRNIDFLALVKLYPQLAGFPSMYSTLQFSDVENMVQSNSEVLKYIPFHLIPISLLTKLVISMGKFIPLHYINELFKIPATTVIELMSHDCGYGYILDLPSTHQVNAVISYDSTKS